MQMDHSWDLEADGLCYIMIYSYVLQEEKLDYESLKNRVPSIWDKVRE
jgi:hypothetical protein